MVAKDNFFRFNLDSGMTVLFEQRKTPLTNILISFKYGSAYEYIKEKGVAHILEHSLFKGTKKRTQKEISEEIEKRGGIINAFTSEDVTAFYSKISSKYFSLASDILLDLTFNPLLEENELKKEKEVILQELKMYHDNPYLHILNSIKELLYKKPFGMNQIGTKKTIKEINREKLLNIFKRNYCPQNSVFCVVGNSNENQIKYFLNSLNLKNSLMNASKLPNITRKNGINFEKRKGLDQTHIAFGFHVDYKKRYIFEIINGILTEGMSSRLFQEIREKRGLAYALKGILDMGKNYGHYLIYSGIEKKNMNEVKRIILEEIKKLKNLEMRDLEEAKEKLIGLRQLAKEDSSNVALCLLQEELFGNAIDFYDYEDRISSVKLEDVKKAFNLKKHSFAAIMPK